MLSLSINKKDPIKYRKLVLKIILRAQTQLRKMFIVPMCTAECAVIRSESVSSICRIEERREPFTRSVRC